MRGSSGPPRQRRRRAEIKDRQRAAHNLARTVARPVELSAPQRRHLEQRSGVTVAGAILLDSNPETTLDAVIRADNFLVVITDSSAVYRLLDDARAVVACATGVSVVAVISRPAKVQRNCELSARATSGYQAVGEMFATLRNINSLIRTGSWIALPEQVIWHFVRPWQGSGDLAMVLRRDAVAPFHPVDRRLSDVEKLADRRIAAQYREQLNHRHGVCALHRNTVPHSS
jgi:hypothetical protein